MKTIPNESEYDVLQAKLCASLLWFVCRLSENGFQNIPQEVTSPIEASNKNELSIRPAVIDYLSHGSMYLYVGSVLYKQDFHTLWDLMQKMSHNGVFVMSHNDEAVTDQDLIKTHPFDLFAHLALMDSLQIVYGNSIVSVQEVLNVVRNFGSFNAAKEMPFDVEDSLVLWLTKVNEMNITELKKEIDACSDTSAASNALILDRSFPAVKNICESFRDTKTMLSLLLYYLPDSLKMESVKLGNSLNLMEKVNNIELFRCLCAEQVCTSVFALRTEDMLFAKDSLKTNFLVLLCEMFYKMEIARKEPRMFSVPPTEYAQLPYVMERADAPPIRHPQLLSKRSKKLFATLNTDEENYDVLLDDLEVKGSHRIPSTVNPHEFRSISHAWQGDSPTLEGRKPEKINLDFRHDYGSFNRVNSSDFARSDGYNSVHSSKSGVNQGSLNENYDGEDFVINHPAYGSRSTLDYLTLYPSCTDSKESDFQSLCLSSSGSWQDVDQKTGDNRFFHETPTDSNFQPLTSNEKLTHSPDIITERSESGSNEEDALSTITEITEPDPISAYSRGSSMSSLTTKCSNEEIDDDRRGSDVTVKNLSNSESKFENVNSLSGSQLTRNPIDNVLLDTISRTYKDTSELINNNNNNNNNNMPGHNFPRNKLPASDQIRKEDLELSDVLKDKGVNQEFVKDAVRIIPEDIQPSKSSVTTLPVKALTTPIKTHATPNFHSDSEPPRGSYTVKHATRESALISGHPIITESVKQSYDGFTDQQQHDLPPTSESVAWYLTGSGLPPVSSINDTNSVFTSDNLITGLNTNSLVESSLIHSTVDSHTAATMINPAGSMKETALDTNPHRTNFQESGDHKISISKEKGFSNRTSFIDDKKGSKDDTEKGPGVHLTPKNVNTGNQECYGELLDIQEKKFKVNVADPLTNLNGLSKLNTLWNTTEKMILKSMVKTGENMEFSKSFVAGDFALKQLITTSNNMNDYDNANNKMNELSNNNDDNNNDEMNNRNNHIHNGIEKILFNSNKMPPNDKVIEDDYTTWMDLFDRSNINDGKMKMNNEMIKKNQEKLKRYKSSLTTWADLPHTTVDGEDENEDETLSIQLAALRMQLEEKRRKFDEEKKRKQEQWREERAKNLQNAFFVMLNNNEEQVDLSLEMDNLQGPACEPIIIPDQENEEVNFQSYEVQKASYYNEDIGRGVVETESYDMRYENTICYTHDTNKLDELDNIPDKKYHELIQNETEFFITQTDPPINPTEIHTDDVVISNRPLSTLIQEFSHFSDPTVLKTKPVVGYPTADPISSVLNELGKNDAVYLTTVNQSGNTPELSTVLDQLGGYSKTQELSTVSSVVNTYPYTESEFLTNTPNNIQHTIHHVIATDERPKLLNVIDNEHIPSTTIDAVLAQVGSSPLASLDYTNILQNEEIINYDENELPPSLENFVESNLVDINVQKEIPRFENVVSKDELPRYENDRIHIVDYSSVSTPLQIETALQPPDTLPEQVSQESAAKTPSATSFVVGVDMMGTPELTPQQIKKRERFLRQRQKNIEEERERKAAELEKKLRLEESTPKKTVKEERPRTTGNNQESSNKRNEQVLQDTPRKAKREVITPRTPRTPQNTTPVVSSTPDESSKYTEYTGPDAYKKPTGKSNRKIIQNAIMHCCLCGEVNKENKNKCLDALEKSEANHFLVLFREGLKFRSVYEYHPDTEAVTRVYGIGPKMLNEKMMIKYYKYNSGGKEFYSLETKHLSIQVDGLMIKKELWEKKQGNSKTDSNLKKLINSNQR